MQKIIILFMVFVRSSLIYGLNYLYQNGQSGFTPGFAVFFQDFKKYQGYSIHIDYTFSGKVSIGLARTGVKSLYSSTIDNEITTINLLQI